MKPSQMQNYSYSSNFQDSELCAGLCYYCIYKNFAVSRFGHLLVSKEQDRTIRNKLTERMRKATSE